MARPALKKAVRWKLGVIEDTLRVCVDQIVEILAKGPILPPDTYLFESDLKRIGDCAREKAELARSGPGTARQQWTLVVTNLQKEIGTTIDLLKKQGSDARASRKSCKNLRNSSARFWQKGCQSHRSSAPVLSGRSL